jgi:hypothetical protein
MRRLVYKDLPVDAGDFRLISRACLSALQQMRGMVAWVAVPKSEFLSNEQNAPPPARLSIL